MNHCFMFAVATEKRDDNDIEDAFLVIAPDRDRAELLLRASSDVGPEQTTRFLARWSDDVIEKRCWMEMSRKPLSLFEESTIRLSELVWD